MRFVYGSSYLTAIIKIACGKFPLTPRRFFSFSERERKEWGRKSGGQSRPPLQEGRCKPEERADEGIGPYKRGWET